MPRNVAARVQASAYSASSCEYTLPSTWTSHSAPRGRKSRPRRNESMDQSAIATAAPQCERVVSQPGLSGVRTSICGSTARCSGSGLMPRGLPTVLVRVALPCGLARNLVERVIRMTFWPFSSNITTRVHIMTHWAQKVNRWAYSVLGASWAQSWAHPYSRALRERLARVQIADQKKAPDPFGPGAIGARELRGFLCLASFARCDCQHVRENLLSLNAI
jgi:hypothetical protein